MVRTIPTKGDVAHVVDRFVRECSTPDHELTRRFAEEAYRQAEFYYDKAVTLIKKDLERQVVESRLREEEVDEIEFQQIILQKLYRGTIQPALQYWAEWPVTLGYYDPLNDPAHSFHLIERLVRSGRVRETLIIFDDSNPDKVSILRNIPKRGWRMGIGISDKLSEAVVLAWAQAFLPEGDDTDYETPA